MRHRKRGRGLDRSSAHRKALRRNLVVSLFERERITTTPAKAKEVRSMAEKMITLAKAGTLTARRRALAELNDKAIVKKLFAEIAPKFQDRPGGYTRILHLDRRRLGDNAPQCIFELVTFTPPKKEEAKKEEKPKAEKAPEPKPTPPKPEEKKPDQPT
jgi:large subunit ribosomal protein L17